MANELTTRELLEIMANSGNKRIKALEENIKSMASEIDRLHAILEHHHIDWTGTPPDKNKED